MNNLINKIKIISKMLKQNLYKKIVTITICITIIILTKTENILLAQPININGNGAITYGTSVNAGVIITDTQYWYNGTSAANSYMPSDGKWFGLSGFNDLDSSAGYPVAGIFSTYADLQLDLAGKTLNVKNSFTGGTDKLQYIAAGFGYASDETFLGMITSYNNVLSNFTVESTSGAAYGMLFTNAAMNNSSNIGSGAFIEVGKLTAKTGSTDDLAIGFQAFNVAGKNISTNTNWAVVSIDEIVTEHTGTGGLTVGILLGNISGAVVGKITNNQPAGIKITGTINGADAIATGFHATEISAGAHVQLGTITLKSDGNNKGNFFGVQVNQVAGTGQPGSSNTTTIGRIAGELIVDKISIGETFSAKSGFGLLLRNDDDVSTNFAPGITSTGLVRLGDITIKSDTGVAVGVSLGYYNSFKDNSYISNTKIDFGYAESGKLVLTGDINVSSTSGDAIGIFAGQIKSLDVNYKIIASGASSSSYGIKTVGKTEGTDSTLDKASIINIISGNSAAGVISGTTKSVSLGATSGDTVNLNVSNWLNGNNAFTMEGVEIFNVTQSNDFTTQAGILNSKRGTATVTTANTETIINNGATLKVLDTFFSEGGKHVLKGGGTLEIKDDATNVGFIDDTLEINGVNVDFASGSRLVFNSTSNTPTVKITNGANVTFNRNGNTIGGIARFEWSSTSPGYDWNDHQLDLTVDGGTLKFAGSLTGGDSAWFFSPFKTSIGSGGATIDIVDDMVVQPGTVERANGAGNITLTKTGDGELKLVKDFDLGSGGTILLSGGILSVNDPSSAGNEIIKNSPNLQMSNLSKFELKGLNATLNILNGSSGTEISLDIKQLKVNSGTFSGKLTGLGSSQLVKMGNGNLIINGDNSEMAGALIQNNGTVTLTTDWGDQTHAGHIDQNIGKIIFNGGGKGVKVSGDVTFKDNVDVQDKITAKSFKLAGDAATVSFDNLNPLNQDWENLITVTNNFDDATQNKLKTSADTTALLYSRTGTFNDTFTTFSLNYETTSLQDYATQNDMTRNFSRVGILLDGLMSKYPNFATTIYSLQQEQVDAVLEMFLGSELAAGAQFLALSSPQHRVFNHLHNIDRSTPSGILGQTAFRILTMTYDLWFEGNYRSESVSGDKDAWGYDVDRGGMFVGVDTRLGDRIISGLTFSYGAPRISNRIGKIAADDISFGIYSRFRLFWECSVNVFLGYGVQNYKYNRAGYTTDYNGDSLYASMELIKPMQVYAYGQLIPVVAIDFQKSWSDAFVDGDAELTDLVLKIGKTNIDQTILRFGLNSKITPTRQFQLRTKLQYGLQVAGDLYASANTSFALNPTITQNIRSIKKGRHNLNIGFGTDLYTADETTKFFLDYDYNYNKRSNAHTIQLGVITTR
ncbi:MAG: autotransporter domain-containing protein [Planctomycetaceae bacterium]|jgi:hypothetical protein|nr:autotransporter domain-containing protein [Planctomycetaceae bacterium]